MKDKLIKAIKSAFEPPPTSKKESFIREINYPKATYWDFIYYQIGYVRKRVWILSVLMLAGFVLFASLAKDPLVFVGLIWMVSAFAPFLALLFVSELARSTSYNMAEMEMTTRYNLGHIMFARMGILGGANLILLLAILPIASLKAEANIIATGLHILVPYLLTCTFSLYVLNKIDRKDVAYYCAGISCAVSVLYCVLLNIKHFLWNDSYIFAWFLVFIVLLSMAIIQAVKLIKKTGDIQWN